MVGGITLVTLLRLFQVTHEVLEERAHPAMGVPIGDHRREAGWRVPSRQAPSRPARQQALRNS